MFCASDWHACRSFFSGILWRWTQLLWELFGMELMAPVPLSFSGLFVREGVAVPNFVSQELAVVHDRTGVVRLRPPVLVQYFHFLFLGDLVGDLLKRLSGNALASDGSPAARQSGLLDLPMISLSSGARV